MLVALVLVAGLTFVSQQKAAGGLNVLLGSHSTDAIERYNPDTGEYLGKLGNVNISNPIGMAIGPDGLLYVASVSNSSIVRFDLETNQYLGVFSSGAINGARGMCFGPGGDIFIPQQNSNIIRINGQTGASMGTFIAAGTAGLSYPQEIIYRDDGMFYVVNNNGPHSVQRFDTNGGFVDVFTNDPGFNTGVSQGMSFSPDGDLYVASSTIDAVLQYDGVSGDFERVFTSGSQTMRPEDMVFLPDGDVLVANWESGYVSRHDGITGDFEGVFASNGRPNILMLASIGPKPALDVMIDIRPGSEPSPINLKSKGSLPVTIYGSDEVDVSQIDLSSLLLQGASPQERGKSGNVASIVDQNGDLILDLNLKFDLEEMDIAPDALELILTGMLLDGTALGGSDEIRIVPSSDGNGLSFVFGDLVAPAIQAQVLPEPATLAMLAIGGVAVVRRRRR